MAKQRYMKKMIALDVENKDRFVSHPNPAYITGAAGSYDYFPILYVNYDRDDADYNNEPTFKEARTGDTISIQIKREDALGDDTTETFEDVRIVGFTRRLVRNADGTEGISKTIIVLGEGWAGTEEIDPADILKFAFVYRGENEDIR